MASEHVNVLGVGISVLNLRTALAAIAAAVRERRKGYVCVTGVHGVMEAQDDAAFKKSSTTRFSARRTACRWSGRGNSPATAK